MPGHRALGERVRGDPGRHRVCGDLGRGQRSRQAVAVAGGDHVDRPGARDDQAVQHGLVAVAVHQRDLVAGDAEMADQAVARGVAVQHEVGEVGAEHTGRVALRLADRAGVLEQRAQFLDRDRQVAAQQPLPEVVVEGASRRRLEEGDTAGVGRGVPGVFVGVVEAAQCPEERRQHGFPVGAGGGGDAARDEARGVLQRPDVAHDRLGHPQRQVPYALVGHHQEDRQVPETAADPVQHGAATRGPVEGAARPGECASRRGERGAGPVTGGPGKVPGHQRRRQTSLGAQYGVRVLRRDLPPDFEAARLDRVPDLP